MNNTKVKITLELEYGRNTQVACMDLPDCTAKSEVFDESIDYVSKGASVAEQVIYRPTPDNKVKRIIENRKVISKQLIEELSNFLLDQMEAKDTQDGYLIKGEF